MSRGVLVQSDELDEDGFPRLELVAETLATTDRRLAVLACERAASVLAAFGAGSGSAQAAEAAALTALRCLGTILGRPARGSGQAEPRERATNAGQPDGARTALVQADAPTDRPSSPLAACPEARPRDYPEPENGKSAPHFADPWEGASETQRAVCRIWARAGLDWSSGRRDAPSVAWIALAIRETCAPARAPELETCRLLWQNVTECGKPPGNPR